MEDIKPIKKTQSRAARSSSVSMQTPVSNSLPDFGDASMLPHRQKQSNNFIRGLVLTLVLASLAGYAGYAVSKPRTANPQKYHAVFLNTGQVYFGTIQSEDASNLVLSNVFYIQTIDRTIPPTEEGGVTSTVPQQQLVMKGDEPYAPSNTIRINRSQIVVVEDLTEQSQILQQIRVRLEAK
ncbi:MAG: hypothetical protein HY422_00120 [Candidatus Komeilibacteria bacterium]|nr:hypothetical protein [Candidatus Komeilibacteria bacterium]